MKPWVLITGASAGIGRELATIFAANGWNLVLVARNEKRLQSAAAELKSAGELKVEVHPKDLAQPNAAAELFHALQDKPISALVNNAGFGGYGDFAKADLGRQTDMMQVNMVALVQLTHLFVQPMLSRHSGRILNVASIAAFQPGPTVNVYYASKAFVYSFSYALAMELEGTGVTVTALCPGGTRTEFFERAQLNMRPGLPMMDARTVARAGFRGMMRGARVVIPGLLNKITARLSSCSPSALSGNIVRRLHQPKPQ